MRGEDIAPITAKLLARSFCYDSPADYIAGVLAAVEAVAALLDDRHSLEEAEVPA
jgi:hypothetical protein